MSSGRKILQQPLLCFRFPQSSDWTDDRLGDTLDAIYDAGLEGIQGAISANIVSEFSISLNEIHYDTTTVSLYGVYEKGDGDSAVVVTYGHSKDHRNKSAIEYDALLDGIFVLICNMPKDKWTAEEVLSLYKSQWKVEGDIKAFKGPFAVSQMYLELPRRICLCTESML